MTVSVTPPPMPDDGSANRSTPEPARLLGCERPLAEAYGVALLDLDGVCFAGEARIEHAADGVNGARDRGMQLSFVTNNASRAPGAVVAKLARNDITAHTGEVFSAAMDAAALLHEHLDAGARVLVVGGDGVREALTEEGFEVVDSADDAPAAVVQGWDPGVDWALLSEGVYAIAAGALHVATNLDATLPTERGFALGNGSLVAAITNVTGRRPLAGGKPYPGIYRRALQRAGGTNPLAVGDRLNTDHVGARAAGIPGLHVLTGVGTARDVVLAPPEERPSYLHTDLRGLLEPHPTPVRHQDADGPVWGVGEARCRIADGAVLVREHGTESDFTPLTGTETEVTLDAYRAIAAAVWEYADEHDGDTGALTVPDLRVRA